MQLYKVKLGENEYLNIANVPFLYSRGEAIKKARAFRGTIEKHGKNYLLNTATIAQIYKDEIGLAIIDELNGRELMSDNDLDLDEKFYYGSVFQDILDEQMSIGEPNMLNKETLDEIYVLSVLVHNYQYVMLIN